MACVSLSSLAFFPKESTVSFRLNFANRKRIPLRPIGFGPIKKNRRVGVSFCRAASVVFRNLDADDFRHPLDRQNTLILRAIPGINELGKALLGLGGLIAQRMEEQLFRWLRAAELTCDRAALLVAQDPKRLSSPF